MTVYGTPREPEPSGDDNPEPPAPLSAADPIGPAPAAADTAAAKPPADPADAGLDEPRTPPWDRRLRLPLRRPLAVVLIALVMALIGVASGVTSAALSGSGEAAVWWQPGEPAPVQSSPPPPPPITISAVGDMIVGSYNFGFPPNNGAGFFDQVKSALAADLVMGNVEQALTNPTGYTKCGSNSSSCFAYAAPPSYAGLFRDAGFDLVTVNNNHTNDYGQQGAANTRTSLVNAGVAVTGGVDEIAYVTVEGVDVAVIGFSPYNWGANLLDIPRAVRLVEQATRSAELVVIQFHGGAEGSDRTRVPPAGQSEYAFGENRGDLRTFSHAVIDAGADLVIGHGPHVLRGIEFYQGRLIAYSLGNFCGYRALNAAGWNGVGAILKVSLKPDGTWTAGSIVATEMVSPGTPAVDTDLRALAFVDNLSVQDFGAGAVRVDHITGQLMPPA